MANPKVLFTGILFVLAGCSNESPNALPGQVPAADSSLATPERPVSEVAAPNATSPNVTASGFVPKPVTSPIAGLFYPEFGYHLRSERHEVLPEGDDDHRVVLELLDIAPAAAVQSVRESMAAAGYTARDVAGSDRTEFFKPGAGIRKIVVVTKQISGGEKLSAPESTGTMFIGWRSSP